MCGVFYCRFPPFPPHEMSSWQTPSPTPTTCLRIILIVSSLSFIYRFPANIVAALIRVSHGKCSPQQIPITFPHCNRLLGSYLFSIRVYATPSSFACSTAPWCWKMVRLIAPVDEFLHLIYGGKKNNDDKSYVSVHDKIEYKNDTYCRCYRQFRMSYLI